MASAAPAPTPPRHSPFDVVVITSPDAPSARAARRLIASSCGDFSAALHSHNHDAVDDAGADADDAGADAGTSVLEAADGTLFVSSCDPYGARMGSGGGTIAALAEADAAYRAHRRRSDTMMATSKEDGASNDDEEGRPTPPSVLICHAGGESSRCPTQIALGKAWTSLPVVNREGGAANLSSGGKDATVANPTALLISTLSEAFRDVPKGSVVVAASDVLLSFDRDTTGDDNASKGTINFDRIRETDEGRGRVLGLAVPAPLATAKNHGVFVLNHSQHHRGEEWDVQPTHEVLQKPTVEEMRDREGPACTFSHGAPGPNDAAGGSGSKERCAWIDTGVVAFLPAAAGTLRALSRSSLQCCTRTGLVEMYKEHCHTEQGTKRQKCAPEDDASSRSSSATPSLEEFARSMAPKICLYGDMLHALRTESAAAAVAEQNNAPTGSPALASLHRSLAGHDLHTCTIPTGSFVHLGTTKELAEFLTVGNDAAKEGIDNAEAKEQRRYQHFHRAMGLTGRADCFVTRAERGPDRHNVVVNSVLASKGTRIGRRSVVEHCHIECDDGIEIGEGCLVSGIRNVKGRSFCVPNGLCLQLLPLRRSMRRMDPWVADKVAPSFVCICVGVEESIKETPVKTLFGLDMTHMLQRYGLTESDLWDDAIPVARRCLWNARINPVLTADEDGLVDFSFLDWMAVLEREYQWNGVRSNSSLVVARRPDGAYPSLHPAMAGLKSWKESTRLSLSEIRRHVDSEEEASYRSAIPCKLFEEKRLSAVSDILMNRRHSTCNFDYVADFVSGSKDSNGTLSWGVLRRALKALEQAASQASISHDLDIVGRAFMTMAALLSDACCNQAEGTNGADTSKIQESLKKSIDRLQSSQVQGDAISSIASMCYSMLESQDGSNHKMAVEFLERAASVMTERCIRGEIDAKKASALDKTSPVPVGATVSASAPARVDLSGGWSDTPPISFEYGGAVACLAVLVDGKRPLRATCRVLRGGSGIKLRTESKNLSDEALENFSQVTIHTIEDLADFRDPRAKCTLLKCALIYLGLVPMHSIVEGDNSTIQPQLNAFCQSDQGVGLEITSTSLLPTGSGMGSSSILAGCILSAIAECVGIKLSGMGTVPTKEIQIIDHKSLIHAVLMVEQLLTTGGGWQDNIGGLVGGLKLGTSDARVLPLQTKVQRYELPPALLEELNERLVLSFCGKPRLAKNILQNVLRRWARRSEGIMRTVESLVRGAKEAISSLEEGDLDELGAVMSRYWKLKVAMAGSESGVEPKSVRSLLDLLSSKGDIVGGTLCGAGGGGFLALLASRGKTLRDIQATAKRAALDGTESDLDSFSWHSCTVSEDGLIVEVRQV